MVEKKRPPLRLTLLPPLLSQFHRPLPIIVIFRHEAALHLLQLRRHITAEKDSFAAIDDPENLVPGQVRAGNTIPDITIQYTITVEENNLRRSLQTFQLSGQIGRRALFIRIFQLAPLDVISCVGKSTAIHRPAAGHPALRTNPPRMVLMEMAQQHLGDLTADRYPLFPGWRGSVSFPPFSKPRPVSITITSSVVSDRKGLDLDQQTADGLLLKVIGRGVERNENLFCRS